MKILFGVQATGNGHISRAMAIIPRLQERCRADVLLSGIQAELQLPFEVKYRMHGMSFIFGKNGGVDFVKTVQKNYIRRFIREVKNIPIEDYDLVITDFEPITAWAAKMKKVPCVALSNQCAAFMPGVPQPKKTDLLGKFILSNYAPADENYAFHFRRYNQQIFLPVIRDEIRNMEVSNNGHYTIYLPAYEDKKIIEVLEDFSGFSFEIFSKHTRSSYKKGNIKVSPINDGFQQSLASCAGIICGAGFSTPSEALYLGKKLLVVPMKNQLEQHINAEALKQMGVPVLPFFTKKHTMPLINWLLYAKPIEVEYPDETRKIVDRILTDYAIKASAESAQELHRAVPQFAFSTQRN